MTSNTTLNTGADFTLSRETNAFGTAGDFTFARTLRECSYTGRELFAIHKPSGEPVVVKACSQAFVLENEQSDRLWEERKVGP